MKRPVLLSCNALSPQEITKWISNESDTMMSRVWLIKLPEYLTLDSLLPLSVIYDNDLFHYIMQEYISLIKREYPNIMDSQIDLFTSIVNYNKLLKEKINDYKNC